MERISLPTRTVATRGVVVIPVTLAAILLVLGWMANLVLVTTVNIASEYYMSGDRRVIRAGGFRTVVITGRNIQVIKDGEVKTEWTLFVEGGKRRALKPYAEKAYKMDAWDPEKRYIFARAYWREHNGQFDGDGRSPGGFTRDELSGLALLHLTAAIRRDPANAFYRATLAGVLGSLPSASEHAGDIETLLQFYPPQNAYGQIRTAQMIAERGGDKQRQLKHYARALELVSSDVQAGLVDTRGVEPGVTSFPSLGFTLVAQVVGGLVDDNSDYASWAGSVPDHPETHWLVGRELQTRRLIPEADREHAKVVATVQRRLEAQKRVSAGQFLFETLCPLTRPDLTDRFLSTEEIGHAASLLGRAGQFEEAMAMRRTQIARTPTDVNARLALGELLLERAAALTSDARGFRDRDEPEKAREAEEKARKMYEEVDEQAAEILRQKPRLPAALDLRRRLPSRPGETPAP